MGLSNFISGGTAPKPSLGSVLGERFPIAGGLIDGVFGGNTFTPPQAPEMNLPGYEQNGPPEIAPRGGLSMILKLLGK